MATAMPVTDPYFIVTDAPNEAASARRAMIREAAYYLAQKRGFAPGRDIEDWLRAERQIDAALAAMHRPKSRYV